MPGSCTGVEVAIGGSSGASGASVGLLPPEVAPLGAAGGEISSGLSSCTITPLLSTYERRRALLHSGLASSAGCAMTACSRLSVDEEPEAIGCWQLQCGGPDTDTVITTSKSLYHNATAFPRGGGNGADSVELRLYKTIDVTCLGESMRVARCSWFSSPRELIKYSNVLVQGLLCCGAQRYTHTYTQTHVHVIFTCIVYTLSAASIGLA